MKNVSESLAGRVGIVRMLGLSTNEINGVESSPFIPSDIKSVALRVKKAKPMSLGELYTRIFNGSMPALYASAGKIDWENFYSSYTGTYLQRDIRDITQVADETSFFNFMTVAAARTAKPVVYDELAKECGISSPTAKKWLSRTGNGALICMTKELLPMDEKNWSVPAWGV